MESGFSWLWLSAVNSRQFAQFADHKPLNSPQPPRAPDEEDGGIDGQLHDGGSDDATDHGSGDAFHHIRAGAVAPENGEEAGDDHRRSHGFGTNALYGAVIDGIPQVRSVAHPAFLLPLRVSQVEVEQHDNAGFRIQSGERDQADPDGDAEIVV